MTDTELDRLRAMREGLDRDIEAPDPRLLADLRRSFTSEHLESDRLDDTLVPSLPATHGRASRRQLLFAALGGAAACGLVVGGIRLHQVTQQGPAAPGVPAVPDRGTPLGTPRPDPTAAGYPPGPVLPMTRNPLPAPDAPPAVSAAPRPSRPVPAAISVPKLGTQEIRDPLRMRFEEYGDELGTAPDSRAIRRWQDAGELVRDSTAGTAATLRRTEATSYRYFDQGSEQQYRGVPFAGHQDPGDARIQWPLAAGNRGNRDPAQLLAETVRGLPPEQQLPGAVGYWTIRRVAELLVLQGSTMPRELRMAYIRALQRVEGVEVTGASSDPARSGSNDVVRIAWMNAIGTASVEVRFIAATGLVSEYVDQRYLDNRVCMPRESGQCTLQYRLTCVME